MIMFYCGAGFSLRGTSVPLPTWRAKARCRLKPAPQRKQLLLAVMLALLLSSALPECNNQKPSYQRAMEKLIQGIERVAPGNVIHVSDPELGED